MKNTLLDTGYDYTLYDSSFLELDGGQLDNPDLSMAAARDEILALHELSREHIEELPVTKFEQEQEAAAKKLHPAYDSSIDTERVDDAAILAYELDTLFREIYDSYEKAYPDIEEQADTITDYLIDGSTVEIKRQLIPMERRVRGNSLARCGVGENLAITSKDYLSLFPGAFSSSDGEDFRAVLEETCRIADGSSSGSGHPLWNWRTLSIKKTTATAGVNLSKRP